MRDILWNTSLALVMALALAGWSAGCERRPAVRATSAPATTPRAGPVEAVVGQVTGLAEFRQTENDPWRPCKAGVRLGMDAELRTGPRSSVVVEIAGRRVTIDRLGVIKLRRAIEPRNGIQTPIPRRPPGPDFPQDLPVRQT